MVLVALILNVPAIGALENTATLDSQYALMGINPKSRPVAEKGQKTSAWQYVKEIPRTTYALLIGAMTLYGAWLQWQIAEANFKKTGVEVVGNWGGKVLDKIPQPQGIRKEVSAETPRPPARHTTTIAQQKAHEEAENMAQEFEQQNKAEVKAGEWAQEFEKQKPQPAKEMTPAERARAQERARRVSSQPQQVTVAQRAKAYNLSVDDFEQFLQAQGELPNASLEELVRQFKEFQREGYRQSGKKLPVKAFLKYLKELDEWEEGVVREYGKVLPRHEVLKFTKLERDYPFSTIKAEELIERYLDERTTNPKLTVNEFINRTEMLKRRTGAIGGHLQSKY